MERSLNWRNNMQNETNTKTIKHRIRKRIIFLGLCLGLAVNQIMIFQANKAIAQSIEVNPYAQESVQKQINPLEIINRVDKQYALNQQKNTNYTPLSQQNSPTIEINNTQNSQNIQTVQPIQNSAVYYPQQPYNENQYYNIQQNYNQAQNKPAKKKSYSERYKEKYGVTPWQGALLGIVAGFNAGQNVAIQNRQRQILEQQYQMNNIQQMYMLHEMMKPPAIQPFSQPKYRVYDQYGRSQGYIQQSNW